MARTFGDVLAIAAVGLAVGYVGAVAFDWHSHQCDRCGNRWSHLGAFNGGSVPAHTCAHCGAQQWWKLSTPPGVRALYEAAQAQAQAQAYAAAAAQVPQPEAA